MAESKAAESYEKFENIRNRFGGAKKSPEPHAHHLTANKVKPKRHFDPRTNAPPLVPLVEESDQIQEELTSSPHLANLSFGAPVKGKWKHSHLIRSNHLTPDFDALETSSEASYSSAYSSHCSDALSPTLGSVSELSDGSSESFFEFDTRRTPMPLSKTAVLKATFEKSLPDAKYNDSTPEVLVSPEIVPTYTKAWNEIIGHWTFEGIPSPPHSTTDETWRPSKEVRCLTPSATPTYGSTNDLLGGGSKTSLISGTFDGSESEESDAYWGLEVKHKLDALAHARVRRKSSIASECQKMSALSPGPESDSDVEREQVSSESKSTDEVNTEDRFELRNDQKGLNTTWSQANQKYNKIIVLKQRRQTDTSSTATRPPEVQQQMEEEQEKTKLDPTSSSIVEQRAKLFGGVKVHKHTKSASTSH